MEQLLLSEYLLACINFEKDPSEENSKVIQDFLNKLSIKSYLSHKNKEMNMLTVLSALPADFDAVAAAGQFEISKIVYGLFSYVTNLQNDINLAAITFFAVDCFYNHGLVDAILKYCEADYHRWEKMVDNSLRFEGIYKMLNSLTLIDGTEYDKWMATMKEFKQEFTPDMIKALSNLAMDGNQSLDELKIHLAEAAVEQANTDLAELRKQAAQLEEKIQEQQETKEQSPEDKKEA